MEEAKYKVVFDHDLNKHVKVILKMVKGTKTVTLIGLIGAIVFWLGLVINSRVQDYLDKGLLVLSIVLIFIFSVLCSSNSKKALKTRLLKIYGNNPIKFVYEFYDDFVSINRTGGEYESQAKMKYSAVVKADLVDDTLGYVSTKEQGVIFLGGNQVKEIVEFVNSKIVISK